MFSKKSKFIFGGCLLIGIGILLCFQVVKSTKDFTRDDFNKLFHPLCNTELRTEQEVLQRTNEKLKIIAKDEEVDINSFSASPKVSFNSKESLWTVDYYSTEKDLVRFTIDACGFLETSFDIRKKENK